MNMLIRMQALEQLHYIDDTYGSVLKLEEGHPELIKLRMLYGCQSFDEEQTEQPIVFVKDRNKKGAGRKSKKTIVFRNGIEVNEFDSLKEAAAAVGVNYSTALNRIHFGRKSRNDGYAFEYI